MENWKCPSTAAAVGLTRSLALAAIAALSLAIGRSALAASYSENFNSFSDGAITSQSAAWTGGNSAVQNSPGGAD